MSYSSFKIMCSKHEHGDMEYIGNGDYECLICGEMYHDYEFDDDYSDEGIDVYEAAYIWVSHGRDEDYTFGYTEEELERAFNR